MNKIFMVLLIILASLLKAYDIDAIIKTVDPEKEYQDANAINVLTEVSYEINPDGTYTHKVFYVKKILNYSGQTRYSDVSIEYDPDYESVELSSTLTVTPEGEKIPVPDNQIYDLNTDESLWSPEYIKHRKRVINFPQIGPGYFIVLEYSVKNTRKLPLSGIEHFQESNPYLEKNLIITFPSSMKIKYYADKNLNLSKDKKDRTVLKWNVKNSPLIRNEPNSPDYLYSGRPVMFSFYKDWKQFNKDELSKILKYTPSEKVKETALKITEGLKTDDEKLHAIYKYIAQNYDSKACYISLMDLTPEPLDDVMNNKFGSSREMTALFIAMAEYAGIKGCSPALLLSNNINDVVGRVKDVVLKDLIEDVYVYRNGIMLKPGDKNRAYGFSDTYDGYVILPDKPEPVKYSYRKELLNEKTYEISSEDKDVIAGITSVSRGGYDSWMRSFERFPEEERNIRFFQWLIRDNTAEFVEKPVFDSFDDLTDPIKVKFRIRKKGSLIEQDGYSYFIVSAFESLPDVSLKERTNDFRTGSRVFNKYTYLISSEMKKVINLSSSENKFEFNGRTAYIKTSLTGKGDQIEYSIEYYIPEMIVPKEKYPEFRDFLMELKNPINYSVFLKK